MTQKNHQLDSTIFINVQNVDIKKCSEMNIESDWFLTMVGGLGLFMFLWLLGVI